MESIENQDRCLMCGHDRDDDAMTDAIRHAPCDQGLSRELSELEPESDEPGFWNSVGQARYGD